MRLDNDEEDGDPPILSPETEDCETTDEGGLEEDTPNHTIEDNIGNLTDFLSPNIVSEPDKINQDAETYALRDKGEWLR